MMAEQTETQPKRNFIRVALDYLLGRNALIGVAALMLLLLSGYATWKGMRDFILGVQATTGAGGGALAGPGGLEVQTEFLITLLVVALTFLMWLALRESFGVRRSWRSRAITFPLYLFLAIWSVGFGYGFWWSLIAGPEATKAGLSGQAEDVRDAAVTVKARLEAVRARLDSVVAHSERQMSREAASGGSCGVASGAGQGPLFKARQGVRDSVSSLQKSITDKWLSAVDLSLDGLKKDLADASTRLPNADLPQRQAAFERAAAEIRGKAGEISARSNSLGAAYADQMRGLAAEVNVKPGAPGFSCFDPTLAGLLLEAAKESETKLKVDLRPAAFSEGAAGVANAVLGLWTNIGDYLSALPSYIAGAEAPSKVEGQGVTGRDLIALLAALGVDLGLFALTALNPPPAPRLSPDAEAEIKRAIGVTLQRANKDLEWLKKHIFSHEASAYFVVPNYYSALNKDTIEKADDHELSRWAGIRNEETKYFKESLSDQERSDAKKKLLAEIGDRNELQEAQALNLLAGVLVDLDLMRLMSRRQLKRARREEERESLSVMPRYDASGKPEYEKIRNHGVLSKARHALRDAGWSNSARRDAEVYIMIDTEGLSPFLKAFNKAGAEGGAATKGGEA